MEYDSRFGSFYVRQPSSTVVLLIHGFTGSPFYFLPFGQALTKTGVAVFAKQLAGHGTTPDALAETTYEDWRSSVLDAYLWLSDRYPEVFVVGHSLGGALAIDLGARFPGRLKGVVTVGAPYAIRHHWLHRSMLPFVRRVKKFHQKKGISVRNYFRSTGCYPSFPLASLKELYAYIDHVFHPCLSAFVDPILVIQPGKDDQVQRRSGEKILQRVHATHKRYLFAAEMEHNPFLVPEFKEQLASHVWNFLVSTSSSLSQEIHPEAVVSQPAFSPLFEPKKIAL